MEDLFTLANASNCFDEVPGGPRICQNHLSECFERTPSLCPVCVAIAI